MYEVQFVPSADRALGRLPQEVQRRIVRAVAALTDDPRPHGSVKLTDEETLWRLQIGQYRVVYSIDDDDLLVLVVRVAHRKDAYRGR